MAGFPWQDFELPELALLLEAFVVADLGADVVEEGGGMGAEEAFFAGVFSESEAAPVTNLATGGPGYTYLALTSKN